MHGTPITVQLANKLDVTNTIQINQDTVEKETTYCVIPTCEACQRMLRKQWAEYSKWATNAESSKALFSSQIFSYSTNYIESSDTCMKY